MTVDYNMGGLYEERMKLGRMYFGGKDNNWSSDSVHSVRLRTMN